MDTSNLLKNCAIFEALGQKDRQALFQLGGSRTYKKGEFIAHLGDIWPYFFGVVKGKILAVKESAEARSLVVTSFSTGEVFWGLAFFNPETPMIVALQAAEETQVISWPREALLPFLLRSGPAAWELCRLMVTRMLRASEILEEMTFQPVAERLANFLMKYPGKGREGPVERSLTLDEMAAHIGTTREMVCRLLHRFSEEQAIQIKRTEFTIVDREKLEGYCASTKIKSSPRVARKKTGEQKEAQK